MTEPDYMDPEAWLRDYQRRADEFAEQAREATESMREISATVTNQHLTLTVGGGGILQSISITDAGSRLSALQLSKAIMDAYAQASVQANGQLGEIVARLNTTNDSPVEDFVRGSVSPELRERAEAADYESQQGRR